MSFTQHPKGKMSEDPNRELRAMILVSTPYPPLPVLVVRFELDDHRLLDEQMVSSHTLLAKAFDEAILRNRPEENASRKTRQLEVLQRFLHVMGTEGFFCGPEKLYQIYCRFTMDHLATYFPSGHPLDLRFQPLSSITKGDSCHGKMAEYMASQSLFYEDAVPVTRQQYIQQDYAQMLLACRDRLGHAMTPEERAKAAENEE